MHNEGTEAGDRLGITPTRLTGRREVRVYMVFLEEK